MRFQEYPAKDGAATTPFCFQAKQLLHLQMHFLLNNGLSVRIHQYFGISLTPWGFFSLKNMYLTINLRVK